MEPVVYTISEVGELLKVNRNSIYELLKKNVIRGLKLGNLKITSTELINFLEENKVKELSNLEDIKELNGKTWWSEDFEEILLNYRLRCLYVVYA